MSFSEQFIQIFNTLADKVGIAIDWSSKNVIPYLQDLGNRLVNYEIATSTAWIAIAIIAIILGICLIRWVIKKGYDYYDIESGWTLVGGALILIGMIIIGSESFDIIQALTIPEKTIYDLIQPLLTK